jgi:hypothetical protein
MYDSINVKFIEATEELFEFIKDKYNYDGSPMDEWLTCEYHKKLYTVLEEAKDFKKKYGIFR